MRVLIIEDETKTAIFLSDGLQESGWTTDVAKHGEEGLRLALREKYDLVLLDVMLPGSDGWSVLKKLRTEGRSVPVIFLTARDAVGERIKGLDLGADDYLVKPFAFLELLARIRSILRRGPDRLPANFRIGDLEIDLTNHSAFRAGIRLNLTPKEFALLDLLARHSGEVMTRKMLAKQVWEMDSESDTNLVDVAVRRLRQKIDYPFPKPLIHSIYGVGYVLDER
jgi:two-component system, OmpR family, copper resistance phosphate regulon response regulator CusR